jgi:hypothetical protein
VSDLRHRMHELFYISLPATFVSIGMAERRAVVSGVAGKVGSNILIVEDKTKPESTVGCCY